VIGSTALVASGSAVGCNGTVEASLEATTEAGTTGTACGGAWAPHAWCRAVAGDVAHLTAGVAAAAGGTTSDAQCRAVSLDVSETLAVIALLGCACQTVCASLDGCVLLSVVRGCGHWLLSWPGCLQL
jgi:hypothetical protein